MITLNNNEILIRKFNESDISNKIRIINDEKNNKFLHYDLPLVYDNTLNWYKKIENLTSRLDCTIEYNNEFVGLIGLLNIDSKNKKAEFYICIDHNYSGRGIGYQASAMFLDYVFQKFELNKIYLYTEEDNIPAQKLFEKLGFVKEGLFKNDLYYNNRYINRYAYALMRGE